MKKPYLIGLAAVVVLIAAVLAAPKPKTGATPVRLASVQNWNSLRLRQVYLWLSPNGGAILSNNGVTVTSTPFGSGPNAAELAKAMSGVESAHLASVHISPDGKYALWNSFDRNWYIMDTKGRAMITRRTSNDFSRDTQAFWMPDSRHWVELDAPESDNKAHILVHDRLSHTTTTAVRDFMPDYYHQMGVTSSGGGIGITDHIGDGAVTVVQYEILPSPTPRAIWFLKMPRDCYGNLQVALSPDGKQLGWCLGETPPLLGINALNQTGFMRARGPSMYSLWVSNVDGTNLHRIAIIGSPDQKVSDLQWTPDSQQMSYIYDGGLWEVAAQ